MNAITQTEDDSAAKALERLSAVAKSLPSPDAAELVNQVLRYQTAIDNISQGVCFFDAQQRLILSNARYAEIYRLTSADTAPGATLRDIAVRRAAAGASQSSAEDYLAWCEKVNRSAEPTTWFASLADGRTIKVVHQPMADGGWVSTHEDVTELRGHRAAAIERVSLQALIDAVPDYLWVKDAQSRFVVANRAIALENGRGAPSELIGVSDQDLHTPELARQFRAVELEILETGRPMLDYEEFVVDSLGRKKWKLTTKAPLRNETGEICGIVGISRDITARKRSEMLRDRQAQILEMIAKMAPLDEVLAQLVRLVEAQLDGIFGSILLLADDGRHARHGAAPSLPEPYTRAVDGIEIGPKVGSCGTALYRRERVIVTDIQSDPLWEDFRELAGAHGLRSCWSTPIISHVGDALGAFAMYSRTVRAPTEAEIVLIDFATRIASIAIDRQRAEDRIHFMANHDALTGLPNRALLRDRLNEALFFAKRHNRWASVIFVDLDNFKLINDSLGHTAGDELLKRVAERMSACVGGSDTVVRLGGDEFVILLADLEKDDRAISEALQRIKAAIAEPMTVEGHTLRVTSSLGIATYPIDGTDAGALLANADSAMYRAKEVGRDNYQFYAPHLGQKAQEKLSLQGELRGALAAREFELHYQPQIDSRTGRIIAVEALIRWRHPKRGLVSPIQFIPLAEETGLIVPIGDWVLHEACRQNKAWIDAGLKPIKISVNVSARQFREPQLIERVQAALSESGLPAHLLELELTESLIMQDVERAIVTMRQCTALGVQLSIDDFGTGYSSLSALKTFPITRLKIDKSFITDVLTNDSDRAVAAAVISLGQKLNLTVVAEGVETLEQQAFLRENNCDEMQGFLFSKPLPAAQVERLLLRGT